MGVQLLLTDFWSMALTFTKTFLRSQLRNKNKNQSLSLNCEMLSVRQRSLRTVCKCDPLILLSVCTINTTLFLMYKHDIEINQIISKTTCVKQCRPIKVEENIHDTNVHEQLHILLSLIIVKEMSGFNSCS